MTDGDNYTKYINCITSWQRLLEPLNKYVITAGYKPENCRITSCYSHEVFSGIDTHTLEVRGVPCFKVKVYKGRHEVEKDTYYFIPELTIMLWPKPL